MIIEQVSESIDPNTQTKYEFPEPTSKEKINDIQQDLLQPLPEINWEILDLVDKPVDINREEIIDKLVVNPERLNRTRFRFKRSGIDGHITGYQEEINLNELGNSNTSLSINRGYTSKSESLRGKPVFAISTWWIDPTSCRR